MFSASIFMMLFATTSGSNGGRSWTQPWSGGESPWKLVRYGNFANNYTIYYCILYNYIQIHVYIYIYMWKMIYDYIYISWYMYDILYLIYKYIWELHILICYTFLNVYVHVHVYSSVYIYIIPISEQHGIFRIVPDSPCWLRKLVWSTRPKWWRCFNEQSGHGYPVVGSISGSPPFGG